MTDGSNYDLNLLVPLAALLKHRNVTEAARSLRIGQPAMSAALTRLRRHYADELLVRVGHRYELTPLARSLLDAVGPTLSLARQTLAADQASDDGDPSRTYTIGVTEYELAILGPTLMQRVRRESPRTRLKFELTRSEQLTDLGTRVRLMDCAILPEGWLSGYPRAPLFSDTLCCVVDGNNISVPDRPQQEDLATLYWVLISTDSLLLSLASRALRVPISEERVAAVVDSHLAQAHMIVGTDLACIMPRRLAVLLRRTVQIRLLDLAEPPEGLQLALYWHASHDRDRGLKRVRGLIAAASAELASQGDV